MISNAMRVPDQLKIIVVIIKEMSDSDFEKFCQSLLSRPMMISTFLMCTINLDEVTLLLDTITHIYCTTQNSMLTKYQIECHKSTERTWF